MDYDITTEEGMRNAIRWFESFVEYIKDSGVWMIPRTYSTYQIDHKHKSITLLNGAGDGSTEKVAKAAGWEVFHA